MELLIYLTAAVWLLVIGSWLLKYIKFIGELGIWLGCMLVILALIFIGPIGWVLLLIAGACEGADRASKRRHAEMINELRKGS